jgi:hypothetical protein
MGVRDREDNRDANPMVNALPAQVIGRRRNRGPPQAEKEGDVVTIDRKVVFSMKPDIRAKWLKNALVHIAQQQIRASDIYEIIASSRFVDGVQQKLGQKMAQSLQDQLGLFSVKQKRSLSSEAALLLKFELAQPAPTKEPADADQKGRNGASVGAPAEGIEDMMQRCRAFVREKMSERDEKASGLGNDSAPASAAEKLEAKTSKAEKVAKAEKLKAKTSKAKKVAKARSSSNSSSGSSKASSSVRSTSSSSETRKKKKKPRPSKNKKKESSSSSKTKEKQTKKKPRPKSSSSSSSSKDSSSDSGSAKRRRKK